ncbi:hypothetical protein BLOT_003492 [Blomia tropicalis]|nr:hypothetical protein BLOT_003492 [Blomia tropicalis]
MVKTISIVYTNSKGSKPKFFNKYVTPQLFFITICGFALERLRKPRNLEQISLYFVLRDFTLFDFYDLKK